MKILKNCPKALPDNGKVVVVEIIVPEYPEVNDETSRSFIVDLIMLANNLGGKERTMKEFECLAKDTGFSAFKAYYLWLLDYRILQLGGTCYKGWSL